MSERILDHVGIAVSSLEIATPIWTNLIDAPSSKVERIDAQGVEITFIGDGPGRIELLAPTRDDSPVARFLQNRGPGIHHLCYRVSDIRAAIEQHVSEGYEAIDSEPKRGAGENLIAFLHPRGTGGVLVELLEAASRQK